MLGNNQWMNADCNANKRLMCKIEQGSFCEEEEKHCFDRDWLHILQASATPDGRNITTSATR
jgi:hypothetical protein